MKNDTYARFAKYYDMLYERKLDYDLEVRWLTEAFRKFGTYVHSVLDLGCGTGGHALRLAARGLDVVGLDKSKEMLAVAKRKARDRKLILTLIEADMSSFSLGREFDAVISMFGGWGYMLNKNDVQSAMHRAHEHLRPGGLFLVEFWNIGGVRGPGYRSWDSVEGNTSLIRWSESNPDLRRSRLAITMNHLVYSRRRVLEKFSNRHVLRLYRPSEMRRLLIANGFRVKGIFRCYPRKGFVKAGQRDFNVVAVAVAR